MKKSKVMYMHTIGGYPAFYKKGEQIYYINKYSKPFKILVSSLAQIKKEEKFSLAYRKKQGWATLGKDYSWIKLLV